MPAARRLQLWVPCLAYMAAIFWLSSLSLPPTVGGDVPAHLVEYSLLGLLLVRALAGGLGRIGRGAALGAWVCAVAYGASDEIHQSFVPGRDASVKDLAMDGLGAALAVTAAVWVARRRARRAPAGHDAAGVVARSPRWPPRGRRKEG